MSIEIDPIFEEQIGVSAQIMEPPIVVERNETVAEVINDRIWDPILSNIGGAEVVSSLGKLRYPLNHSNYNGMLPPDEAIVFIHTNELDGSQVSSKVILLSAYNLPTEVLFELGRLAILLDKEIIIWPNERVSYITSESISHFSRPNDCLFFFCGYYANDQRQDVTYLLNGNIHRNYFLEHNTNGITENVWRVLDNTDVPGIQDESGCYMAYAGTNGLCINVDLFFVLEEDIFKRKEFIRYFCNQAHGIFKHLPVSNAAVISPEAPETPSIDERLIDEQVQAFDYFNKTYKEIYVSSIKNKFKMAQQEKTEHLKALLRLEYEISQNETLARSVARKQSGPEFSPESIKKTLTNFFQGKKYKRFVFHSDNIEAYTENIYITYKDKEFLIGQFKITVHLDGKLYMENLTNAVDDYDHPHVNERIPCLGTIKEIVPKMIHAGDFLGLFGVLHQYLCSYNNDSPYKHIALWGNEEDWCGACDNSSDECSCERCSECNCLVDDCECERCPRTGILLSEERCENCSHNTIEDGCNYR